MAAPPLSSPPPCGEGSGVGVDDLGTAVPNLPDPPPHPSPTRGEGGEAAMPHALLSLPAAPGLPDLLRQVTPRRGLLGFARRHPAIAIGGALVLAMLLIALFAPFLGTVDPTALAPARRTREPSATFWFGTDMLGRDIYSRVLYGTRVSLTVGFSV